MRVRPAEPADFSRIQADEHIVEVKGLLYKARLAARLVYVNEHGREVFKRGLEIPAPAAVLGVKLVLSLVVRLRQTEYIPTFFLFLCWHQKNV